MKPALVLTLLGTGFLLAMAPRSSADEPSVIGRWDIVCKVDDATYPSWLEVRLSGHRTLVGSFVGRSGSARPISRVEFGGGRIRFALPPQWEDRSDDQVFEGTFRNDTLSGETTDEQGRRVRWEGRRAPSLARTSPPRWGQPIALLNGKDLTGWAPKHPRRKSGWVVRDGVLVNAEPGNDLRTDRQFEDFKLSGRFRFPKGSNSGIYLRGRYEVQIEDNYGEEPDHEKIGGVYGFLTPRINPAKPAGEWQTIEVTLVGRTVTVVLNGETIIDRQIIPGITGGALDSDEARPGPLVLQGDHGPVEFRDLVLTPAE